jgi:hypothetical protein
MEKTMPQYEIVTNCLELFRRAIADCRAQEGWQMLKNLIARYEYEQELIKRANRQA